MNNRMNLKRFLSALFVGAVALSSCQPDGEEPTPDDIRDPFVDSWTLNENSSQIGQTTYTVHITKSTTNESQVLIENFYNIGFGIKAKADISGSSVTIPQQTYNGSQLNGSGSKTGTNTISLTYYMNNGSSIDTCTATLSRQ